MKSLFSSFLVVIAVGTATPSANAHFKLLAPTPTLIQDDRVNPQKLGPCGGTTADKGTPSNVVNKITGGQKLHIKIEETVYHPGHYRVALAVNSPAQLPADPEVMTRPSDRGPWSVSAAIDKQLLKPVLAEGLFVHTERPTAAWEIDVDIPNFNCEKCTLQIVQFMAEHALNPDGGYFYHHCAELQIRADPGKPVDTSWK
jgi:hypothetical protein